MIDNENLAPDHNRPLDSSSINASSIAESNDVTNPYVAWAEQHPLIATAAETVAVFAIKRVARSVGEKYGVNLDNGHIAHKYEQAARNPIAMAAQTILAEPLVEELVFRRLLPEAAKRKFGAGERSKVLRIVDLVALLGFTAAHIGNPITQKGKDNLAVPISPLLGGAHYGYVAQKRGLQYSVAAHTMHNGLRVTEAVPKIRRARQR